MHNPDDVLNDLLSIDEDELSDLLAYDEEELAKAMAAFDVSFPATDSELFELAGITNDLVATPHTRPDSLGHDAPDTATTRITIRIDSYVLAECRRESKRLGIPYQTLINQILRAELMKRTADERLQSGD